MDNIWGALAGLVWGALAAFANSRITCACLAKGTQKAILLMNFLHLTVDLFALALVFFLRKVLPFDFETVLIATAVSLSLLTIVFSYKIGRDGKKG